MSNEDTSQSTNKSQGELSHKEVAEKVVAPKRQYFFPDYGRTVEVEDSGDENKNIESATKLVEKEVKAEKGTE